MNSSLALNTTFQDLILPHLILTQRGFDPELRQNDVKYDALEEFVKLAAEVGCTLPQLAVAFTVAHPAVTSVIIGPRTMEHLDDVLAGAALVLDDAVMDRIDEIVPPGTNVYHPDGVWQPRPIVEATLRRRPVAERAAADG